MPEFLTILASFCHDRISITKLLELITAFDTHHVALMASTRVLHKYYMASLLFQIGQICHELSECLLPKFQKERGSKVAKTSIFTNVFKMIYKKFCTQIYTYPHVIRRTSFALPHEIDLLTCLINSI